MLKGRQNWRGRRKKDKQRVTTTEKDERYDSLVIIRLAESSYVFVHSLLPFIFNICSSRLVSRGGRTIERGEKTYMDRESERKRKRDRQREREKEGERECVCVCVKGESVRERIRKEGIANEGREEKRMRYGMCTRVRIECNGQDVHHVEVFCTHREGKF